MNASFVLQERKKRGETDEQAFLADVYAYQVCSFLLCFLSTLLSEFHCNKYGHNCSSGTQAMVKDQGDNQQELTSTSWRPTLE